jgi:hypothetical protein
MFQTTVLTWSPWFERKPNGCSVPRCACIFGLKNVAADCAEKALCAFDHEARRTFAELAEQWRVLAATSSTWANIAESGPGEG